MACKKVAFLTQTVRAIRLELNKNKVPRNRKQEKFLVGEDLRFTEP
jgi:hypothetical protein